MGLLPKLFFTMAVSNGKKRIALLESLSSAPFDHAWTQLHAQMQANQSTAYGELVGLGRIATYEDFRTQIPFSDYSTYEGYIRNMKDGASNQITIDPIEIYAVTSGSVDNPKNIPNTTGHIDAAGHVMQFYPFGVIARDLAKQGKKIPNKKIYQFLECKYKRLPSGVPVGSISGYGVERMKRFLPLIYATPAEAIFQQGANDVRYIHARAMLETTDISCLLCGFMTGIMDVFLYMEHNMDMLLHDIETGTINPDAKLSAETIDSMKRRLRPKAKRARELRKLLENGFAPDACQQIWPHLTFVFAVGTGPFTSKTEKIRKYIGDIPIYFSMFGSSEGLFGLSPGLEQPRFLMMPTTGLHEFIPIDQAHQPFPRALNMEEVEIGQEYELVISNLSGFYRYRMADVVRVVDKQGRIPIIEFRYRLNQLLSLAGEKTNETHLIWCVKAFEEATGLDVNEYSVEMKEDVYPQRYCVYLEVKDPVYQLELARYAEIFNDKLSIANPSYGAKVENGTLAPLTVKFVQPETYLLHKELQAAKGVAMSQIKPVRIIDTPMKHGFFNALLDDSLEGNCADDFWAQV